MIADKLADGVPDIPGKNDIKHVGVSLVWLSRLVWSKRRDPFYT